ncbi:MAG: hypothetical protein ACI841_002102 [Planctomycetota bacterium]|jgi:hypothetical protein
MWDIQVESLEATRGARYSFWLGDLPLTFGAAIELMRVEPVFRARLIAALAGSDYPAFLWECPPITNATLERIFEFVVIDSPALAQASPEPDVFADCFQAGSDTDEVASFPSLGGDALLVVPARRAGISSYTSLASFVRSAHTSQVDHLWRVVGDQMAARLCARPTWLSTSGLGVSWLHVRLDWQPKYYAHGPYRKS